MFTRVHLSLTYWVLIQKRCVFEKVEWFGAITVTQNICSVLIVEKNGYVATLIW